MAQNPDIQIVVGANKVETKSTIESDLNKVAEEINNGSNYPRVAVGVNADASRPLFESGLKDVAKGLSLSLDTGSILKAFEKFNSTTKSTAQTSSALSDKRKTEIRQMIDDTVKLQQNLSLAYDKLYELTSGKKISRTSAVKYLKELTKVSADPFEWTEKLDDAELAYFRRRKQIAAKDRDYKAALDNIKRQQAVWNSFAGQGLLDITKNSQGYARDFLKNIKPIEFIQPSDNLSSTISNESSAINTSNVLLEQHAEQVHEAVKAEAAKAIQSKQTTGAIDNEADAVAANSEAFKQHIETIDELSKKDTSVNIVSNVKGNLDDNDIDRIEQLAKDARSAEYELQKITVDKYIDDGKTKEIVGTLTYYNRELSQTITQHYTAAKSADEEEASIRNLTLTQEKLAKSYKKTNTGAPQQYNELAKSLRNKLEAEIKSAGVERSDVVTASLDRYINSDKFAVNSVEEYKQLQIAVKAVRDNLSALRQEAKAAGSLDPLVAMRESSKDLPTKLEDIRIELNNLSDKNVKIGETTIELTEQYNKLAQAIETINSADFSVLTKKDQIGFIRDTQSDLKLLQGQLALAKKTQKPATKMTPEQYSSRIKGFTSQVDQIAGKLAKLPYVSDKLQQRFDTIKNTVSGISDEWDGSVEKINLARKISAEIASINKQIGAEKISPDNIMAGLQDNLPKYSAQITKWNNGLTSISASQQITNAKSAVDEYAEAYNKLNELVNQYYNIIDQPGDHLEELKKITDTAIKQRIELERLKKSADAAVQAVRSNVSAESTYQTNQRNLQSLLRDYNTYNKNNTNFRKNAALSYLFDSNIKDVQTRLGDRSLSNAEIKQYQSQLHAFKDEVDRLGLSGLSYADKVREQMKKLSVYFSGTAILGGAMYQVKAMTSNVIALDSAMTELKKVTDEADVTYDKFLDDATRRAKNLGTTLSDVVIATADYARLGYSLNESSVLADAAIIYKNVGDGIKDISTASESIISTMKAFSISAKDAMSIVDKFNKVGNEFAISSAGIGEALLRSASSLATAGNSLDESIALIAAMNEVIQDPDVVGTAVKTISMRFRKTKGELEELGEDAQGAAESVTQLQTQLLNLTHGKVNIIEADGTTFKSTYKAVQELADVWDELTDVERAAVTELVAGVRQGNAFSALMKGMATANDVVTASLDSQGSAYAENEKYLDSIEGKLSQLRATYEALSNTIIDSDVIKGSIDGGTKILDILEKIAKVSSLGFLGGTVNGISAMGGAGLFDLNSFNESRKSGDSLWKSLSGANFIGQHIGQNKRDIAIIDQAANALDKLNATYEKGKIPLEEYNAEIGILRSNFLDLSNDNRGVADSYLQFGTAENIDNTSKCLHGLSDKLKNVTFQSKLTSLGISALNTALNALIGFGIGAGIQLIAYGIQWLATTNQRAIDTAKKLTNEWKEQIDTLKTAKKFISDNADELERLSSAISDTGENVGLTDDEYERYIELSDDMLGYMPNLTKYYNEQGEAVVVLKNGVADLNDELEKQAKLDRDKRNIGFAEVYEGFYSQSFKSGDSTSKQIEIIKNLLDSNDISDIVRNKYGDSYDLVDYGATFNQVHKILQAAGYEFNNAMLSRGINNVVTDDFSLLISYLNVLQNEIDYSGIRQHIQDILIDSSDFKELDDNLKSSLSGIFNNLDYTFFEKNNIKSGNAFDTFFKNEVIAPLIKGDMAEKYQTAINIILNPDKTQPSAVFQGNLERAFESLPESLQSVVQGSFDRINMPDAWTKKLADKLKIDLHSLLPNKFTRQEVEVILSPDFIFDPKTDIHEQISKYLEAVSPEVKQSTEISKAIDDYNDKLKVLNELWYEQQANGGVSAEQYEYIRHNLSELTKAIDVQYDELGNATGLYTIAESKLDEYNDTLLESTKQTLIQNNATAEEIAQLDAYHGSLGSVYSRISSLLEKMDELADAYVKAGKNQGFTYAEMVKLKDAYSDLQFEFNSTTQLYDLYPESAMTLIDANNNIISSFKQAQFALSEWKTAFMDAGMRDSQAEQYLKAVKKYIDENSITSIEEYAKSLDRNVDDFNDGKGYHTEVRDYVIAYTDYLKQLESLKTREADARKQQTLKAAEERNKSDSTDTEKAFDKYKRQLDMEKSALEAEMKLDPKFAVYNIASMTDYYNTLGRLAENAYKAQEIDAVEYQEYLIEIFNGLKEITVDEYNNTFDKLETERSKFDAGMIWDKSVFTDLEDYYNRIEKLNEEKYKKSLINASDYASKLVEIFNGRNELIQNKLNDFEHDIMLWQNHDKYWYDGQPQNEAAIIEQYRMMQDIVHNAANNYRAMMEGQLTPDELEHSEIIKGYQKQWWEYEDNIRSIIDEMFSRELSAYEDYISRRNSFANWGADSEVAAWRRVNRFLESSYNNGIIDYKKYLEQKLDAMSSMYNAELQQQRDYADAANRIMQKELDELEKQREVYEQNKSDYETVVSTVVDFIDEQIDKLQSESDELDKQLQLQKAILEVEKARSQRTKRIYREGEGFVWEADAEEIANAQESLDELTRSQELDNQINALEEYKKAWQATVDDYQKNLDRKLVADKLGADWEQQLLDMRTDYLQSFANEYSNNCDQLSDKLAGTVAYQIKQLQELQEQWNGTVDEVEYELGRYDELMEFEGEFKASGIEARLDMLDRFREGAVFDLQAIKDEAATTMAALSELTGYSFDFDAAASVKSAEEKSAIDEMKLNASAWHIANENEQKVLADRNKAIGEAFGWYRDENLGIWYDKNGKRLFADGGVADFTGLAMLHGKPNRAETIFNADDSAKLYEYVHSVPNLVQDLANRMNVRPEIVGRNSAVPVEIREIHLHDVNDVDGFADAIVRTLPTKLTQKLGRMW